MKTNLIIFLVVAALAGGVYIAYYKNAPNKSYSGSKTATTTSAADATKWEIYRNESYGIEFKYPPTWKMVESDPSPGFSGVGFNAIRFYEKSRMEGKTEQELETLAHHPDFEVDLINGGKPPVVDQEWIHNRFGSYKLTDRTKIIGGREWVLIQCATPLCEPEAHMMAVYLAEALTTGVSMNREDILSTFTFIK